MTVKTERTGRTASEAYRQMARRLNAEALKADRSRRPIAAGRIRHQARIAMKAAEAEEINAQPTGLEE